MKFKSLLLIICLFNCLSAETWQFEGAAVNDLGRMTKTSLFANWLPKSLPEGTSPQVQGKFVMYRHEGLTYFFGPYLNETEAQKAEKTLQDLRKKLISINPKFQTSTIAQVESSNQRTSDTPNKIPQHNPADATSEKKESSESPLPQSSTEPPGSSPAPAKPGTSNAEPESQAAQQRELPSSPTSEETITDKTYPSKDITAPEKGSQEGGTASQMESPSESPSAEDSNPEAEKDAPDSTEGASEQGAEKTPENDKTEKPAETPSETAENTQNQSSKETPPETTGKETETNEAETEENQQDTPQEQDSETEESTEDESTPKKSEKEHPEPTPTPLPTPVPTPTPLPTATPVPTATLQPATPTPMALPIAPPSLTPDPTPVPEPLPGTKSDSSLKFLMGTLLVIFVLCGGYFLSQRP